MFYWFCFQKEIKINLLNGNLPNSNLISGNSSKINLLVYQYSEIEHRRITQHFSNESKIKSTNPVKLLGNWQISNQNKAGNILNMLEASTKDISNATNPRNLEESKNVAQQGGNVAKVARKELDSKTDQKVVSSSNAKKGLK